MSFRILVPGGERPRNSPERATQATHKYVVKTASHRKKIRVKFKMCILLCPLWQTINEKIERLSIDMRYWFCKWEISLIKYCSMTYNFTIKCAYVVVYDHSKNNYAQRTHGVIITSILRRFWRYNDVIIVSCVSWVKDICETESW